MIIGQKIHKKCKCIIDLSACLRSANTLIYLSIRNYSDTFI
jgi:hypothetical protein